MFHHAKGEQFCREFSFYEFDLTNHKDNEMVESKNR